MKLSKLNNLLKKYSDGILNSHSFIRFISSYKSIDGHENFVKCLYDLYKLHDALYKAIEIISYNKQNDHFLDLSEKIIGELSNLKLQLKTISSQNTDDKINELIDSANLATRYYMKYFYTDNKPNLGDVIGVTSYKFQSKLHEFLDAIFFSYIKFLKSKS